MTLTFKTNHVEEGLGLLLSQFKEKVNIEATLTAFLEQIQDLEDLFASFDSAFAVDTAVGEQLNILGRIVGQPREGRDDDTYRLWIKARIAINKSSGTAEQIYTVLKALTNNTDSGSFQIIDYYPASVLVYAFDAVSTEDAQVIVDILNEMKPICISFSLIYTPVTPFFQFTEIGGTPGVSFSDIAGVGGGYFSGVIEG